jgi:hypothetical protein
MGTLHHVVVRLIMRHAYRQGKYVRSVDEEDDQRDAIAPEGIGELKGPTAIFVQLHFQSVPKTDLIRDLQRIRYWVAMRPTESVLIVWAAPTRRTE